MEPLGLILGLPLAPLRGLIRLAELLQEQAEQELRSPAAVRRRLEELAEARASGEISEEEEAAATERILGEMIA
ncbi:MULTISPECIES: gas vesicle protein GvpG [unclassified Streptosporangium]|uniref:gas vesicle protein GvpG n=1 Tax=unclassified Streptosporangium TaxID=2632669 RepID=UPI002E2CC81F|nr:MULTISPECIES: gas vesicle protein GvpG [unclassified Streptosporangium]